MRYALVAMALLFAGCADDRLHGFGDEPQQDELGPPCLTALDCADGQQCVDGNCVDRCATPPCDPPPPVVGAMDVSGDWLTTYHLDWSDYLGPLADMGSEIDMLDQLLMGNSDISSLPIIGAILQQIIDQYIPPWVGDLVHILNNLVHFFQDVRIEARMNLQNTSAPLVVSGSELWDWGYVQIIDNCPYGEQDPNYPACADVAVPLNYYTSQVGTIGAEARPFSGSIVGGEIQFQDREVRMQISQFVLFILDMVTRIATNWQYTTFEGALTGLIDCAGFAAALQAQIGLPLPFIEAACIDTRDQLIDQLISALDAITIAWEVMQFDQRAVIIDNPADNWADKLGNPPTSPGLIENGTFELLLGADLTGTWSGVRP